MDTATENFIMDDWLLPILLVVVTGLLIWQVLSREEGSSSSEVPGDQGGSGDKAETLGNGLQGPAIVHPGVHRFFAGLEKQDVVVLIEEFNRSYADDWVQWDGLLSEGDLTSRSTAEEFRAILRKWQAVRPGTVVATEELQKVVEQAAQHVEALGFGGIRTLATPTPVQKSAIQALWGILQEGLAAPRRASDVGVTKAMMLLTHGRLGPALDSNVRSALGLGRVETADELLAVYGEIAKAVVGLEHRMGANVVDIVPDWAGPVKIGRAIDMMLGPQAKGQPNQPEGPLEPDTLEREDRHLEEKGHDGSSTERPIPPADPEPLDDFPTAGSLVELVAQELARPTLIKGCRSTFTAYYDARRRKIHVSNLGQQPWLPVEVLEVALLLMNRYGRVPKGKAMTAKLGDEDFRWTPSREPSPLRSLASTRATRSSVGSLPSPGCWFIWDWPTTIARAAIWKPPNPM